MRCIRELVHAYCDEHHLKLTLDEFEVRISKQLPGLNYDAYISSGGPGSPLESEGSEWENKYFNWITSVERFNNDTRNPDKKFILFICHSFQLACRYFKVGNVLKRKSTAFGVFPVHMINDGQHEPVFNGLQDPFYAVDSRDYQVVQPDYKRIEDMGGEILAIEKERPHVPLERAVMAMRFNSYMVGTQFHPEADAEGMSMYLQRNDRKEIVVKHHGIDKWHSMIEQLDDPDKIKWTYSHVIPNYLALVTDWNRF